MTQYLLSVHMVEGQEAYPNEEAMQQAYKEVDAFNAELQASGSWVFAGGLHPPTTATVVRTDSGEIVTTDGPFAETKEQLGGFWIVDVADLDAALDLGRQRARWPAVGPVEVRPFQETARGLSARVPAASCGRCRARSSGGSPGGPSPPWSASSATSTSPRRRSRRPSSPPPSGGR